MKRRPVKRNTPLISTKKTKNEDASFSKEEEKEHRLVAQLVIMHGFSCSINKFIFSTLLDKDFLEWSKKNAYQHVSGFYSLSAKSYYSHYVILGCVCLLETSFKKNQWSHLVHVITTNHRFKDIQQEAFSLCRGPKSMISQFVTVVEGEVVVKEQSTECATSKHVILVEEGNMNDPEKRQWIVKVRAV